MARGKRRPLSSSVVPQMLFGYAATSWCWAAKVQQRITLEDIAEATFLWTVTALLLAVGIATLAYWTVRLTKGWELFVWWSSSFFIFVSVAGYCFLLWVAFAEQWFPEEYKVSVLGKPLRGTDHLLLVASFFPILIFFYATLVLWQNENPTIFLNGPADWTSLLWFELDLVARGTLLDVMEHWDLHLTRLVRNPENTWFQVFTFGLRAYVAYVLIRAAVAIFSRSKS